MGTGPRGGCWYPFATPPPLRPHAIAVSAEDSAEGPLQQKAQREHWATWELQQ